MASDYTLHIDLISWIFHMQQKAIRGKIHTYNEYMHIAQALRTLIIEDKKSIRRFDGSRLPNYQSVTINFH